MSPNDKWSIFNGKSRSIEVTRNTLRITSSPQLQVTLNVVLEEETLAFKSALPLRVLNFYEHNGSLLPFIFMH